MLFKPRSCGSSWAAWTLRTNAGAMPVPHSVTPSPKVRSRPLPRPRRSSDHVFHLFVVRSSAREALRDHLEANGISNAIHYPTPIHLQPAYASLGLQTGSLPVAERLASESCSLPIFPAIDEQQIERIAAAVASFPAE